MTLIRMKDFSSLFKDRASYERFVQIFQEALSGGEMPMVLTDEEEVLFTAISPESTKEVLCGKILERLSENPSLVDDLRDRLENDNIVD
jgi:hypothetical protein